MKPTWAAILARTGGDPQKAAEYCLDIALCNKLSLETRLEYSNLAKHFQRNGTADE